MSLWRFQVSPLQAHADPVGRRIRQMLGEFGISSVESVSAARVYLIDLPDSGSSAQEDAKEVTRELLADPVVETCLVLRQGEAVPEPNEALTIEVWFKPGVTDNVAHSIALALRDRGIGTHGVRSGRRYELHPVPGNTEQARIRRLLGNDCIEEVVIGAKPIGPPPEPPVYAFQLRSVPIRDLDDASMQRLSREGHLFLSLMEMRAIQRHFREAGRDPTDLELETLAQTWSEHCVHKTLKSAITYRGAPFPNSRDMPGDQPPDTQRSETILHYDNLLQDTIGRATTELMAEGRGPECLSVFVDNAGIVGFDDDFGIAFKVETHNHPSAIEPYGGAATGIGGVIRDILGCGLGAKPIANTDVFCVAPPDWPIDSVPKGVIHPKTVLKGVVSGVRDYGNRMGIPTVNGAVHFDPRYLGNPLVYCGCVGLIPRDRIEKAVRPGDAIVLIGGRTGRDGIHGATFSSAELTDQHGDEFAHAVQIGNPIEEKKVLDLILQARGDSECGVRNAECGVRPVASAPRGGRESAKCGVRNAECETTGHADETTETRPKPAETSKRQNVKTPSLKPAETSKRQNVKTPSLKPQASRLKPHSSSLTPQASCLFSSITDCGAGGLSSAVGEMGEHTGAEVHLDRVPLKYAGLRYDEIWISEAQERMVLSVPPDNVETLLALARSEDVEATVIGEFTDTKRLVVKYEETIVGDLDMAFLHEGLPKTEKSAVWWPAMKRAQEGGTGVSPVSSPPGRRCHNGSEVVFNAGDTDAKAPCLASAAELKRRLGNPTTASKHWIIRQYDHEVQAGSVVKPLVGRHDGPSDAAVIRPRLDSDRGIAIGCGLAPHVGDIDPYWMAVAAIDEAVRNVVCVGGDPQRTAILDNFCWPSADDPHALGALVRACQACYDVAMAYGVPFVSGKDSLNNVFALNDADTAMLREIMDSRYPETVRSLANQPQGQPDKLSIPYTLLISALALIDDVSTCVDMPLKQRQGRLYLIGRRSVPGEEKRGSRPAFDLNIAARTHRMVADLIRRRLVAAVHDVSEGGLLTACAEMCIASGKSCRVHGPSDRPGEPKEVARRQLSETGAGEDAYSFYFEESPGLYIVEPLNERCEEFKRAVCRTPNLPIASFDGEESVDGPTFEFETPSAAESSVKIPLAELESAWKTTLDW